MKKLFACTACAALIVLAVSVWWQLQPETQTAIVTAWSGLVRFLADLVDEAVASASSS